MIKISNSKPYYLEVIEKKELFWSLGFVTCLRFVFCNLELF